MSDDSKKYTLTLDSDGGFGQDGMPLFERRKVEYDKPVGTLPRPRKVGFRFNGWFRRLPSLDKNKLVDNMKYPSRRDLTYTAMWKANNLYTITWMNGKTTVDTWSDKPYGSYYGNLPNATPPSIHDEFVGWYLDSESGDVKADSMTMVDCDRTWHARWRRKEYTISFKDRKFRTEIPDIVVQAGDAIGQLPDPRVIGYGLDGWYVEGVKIDDKYIPSRDATAEAEWYPIEYDITWNADNCQKVPETDDYPRNYTIESGDIIPPPLDQGLVNEDYYFSRWVPESIAHGSTGNRMFTAIVEKLPDPPTFVLMLDADGGYVSPNHKEVKQWKPIGDLPTPEKEGHVFQGWFVGDQ